MLRHKDKSEVKLLLVPHITGCTGSAVDIWFRLALGDSEWLVFVVRGEGWRGGPVVSG